MIILHDLFGTGNSVMAKVIVRWSMQEAPSRKDASLSRVVSSTQIHPLFSNLFSRILYTGYFMEL